MSSWSGWLRHAAVFDLGEHCHHGPRHRVHGDLQGICSHNGQQWRSSQGEHQSPSPSLHTCKNMPSCSGCKVLARQARPALCLRACRQQASPIGPRFSFPCRVSSDRYGFFGLRTVGGGAGVNAHVLTWFRPPVSFYSHPKPRPRRKTLFLCSG